MKRLTIALLERWLSETRLETMPASEHWYYRGRDVPLNVQVAFAPGSEACVGHFLIAKEGEHFRVDLAEADLDYYKSEALALLSL